MTVAERIALYKQLLNTSLNSGPDLVEDLEDLKQIRDAALRIVARTNRRFGFSAVPGGEVISENEWKTICSDPEVQALESKIKAAMPKSASAGDKGGPFMDLIQQFVQLVVSNPAVGQLLLQLIMGLLKKPA